MMHVETQAVASALPAYDTSPIVLAAASLPHLKGIPAPTPDQLRQVDLEADMLRWTRERLDSLLRKAREDERESETPGPFALLRAAVEPTAAAIKAVLAEAASGKAGTRHRAIKYLLQIDPQVAAMLTAKTILNGISKRVALTAVAANIATAIEDEVRFAKFEEEDEDKFDMTSRKVAGSASYRYRRAVMSIMMGRAAVEWTAWPHKDRILLGALCVELFRDATGLVEVTTVSRGKKNTPNFVLATDAAMKLIHERNANAALLEPTYWPMVCPPRDWTGPTTGGYMTDELRRARLVKHARGPYLEELRNREMPVVYRAVNAIQSTPWRVNGKVLAVLKDVWDKGLEIGALPSREPLPLPAKPWDIADNKDARNEYRKLAALAHEANLVNRSKAVQLMGLFALADRFKDEAAIYFPHNLDFRGRVYALPSVLNPQGDDRAKSLLTFAAGKPINDAQSLGWLMVHGANLFGFDKVGLGERLDWVSANETAILASAADPLGSTFWTQADKPWQFLAFCFEWEGFQAEGYGFVSSLPVALDGSCNGLQHFAAMLKDEHSGAEVNLLPADKPKDIYQRVADTVTPKLRLNASLAVDDPMPAQWLAFGVDRKMAKRPVMVLPYGGTQYSCREYVEQAIRDRIAKGDANPFTTGDGNGIFQASLYLAGILWGSIGEVVTSARTVMTWLRAVAVLASAEGLPIVWSTPTGFPVMQAYRDLEQIRVRTKINGSVTKLMLIEETMELCPRRQRAGISPNYVHSMDAAALMLYVDLALTNGITSFACIHDSYGTVAADVEMMSACLRRAFVDLYEDGESLTRFRNSILAVLSPEAAEKLPPVPALGNLDLTQVERAEFFFA